LRPFAIGEEKKTEVGKQKNKSLRLTGGDNDSFKTIGKETTYFWQKELKIESAKKPNAKWNLIYITIFFFFFFFVRSFKLLASSQFYLRIIN
jgi:hypothetical protein